MAAGAIVFGLIGLVRGCINLCVGVTLIQTMLTDTSATETLLHTAVLCVPPILKLLPCGFLVAGGVRALRTNTVHLLSQAAWWAFVCVLVLDLSVLVYKCLMVPDILSQMADIFLMIALLYLICVGIKAWLLLIVHQHARAHPFG